MADPKKNPESHYDLEKLHKIFAIVALILLSALGILFLKDYSRQWKDFQKEFRALDIEKTRVRYDGELNALLKNPDYEPLKKDLEQARKDFDAKCATLKDVQSDINKIQAENDALNQTLKFTRAELDATRYRLEEAVAHNHNVEKAKADFDEYTKKTGGLTLKVEQSTQKLNEKTKVMDTCGAQLKELEKKDRTLSKAVTLFERKLKKIDPDKMTLTNRFAQLIRDLPIIDMSNPNAKIEQIVLQDITEDVNFKQVPRVDRCITCHLGISNPDYKEAPQPFTSHPNLELYLGNNSTHPLEEFGCTVCHGGRGRGTSFNSTVHTPSSEEQKEEWEKKYHWHSDHLWPDPMLPLPHTQASCFKCHSGETSIKGAEKLNLGLNLIERAGCYNCHTIDKYKDWPKSGPGLTKLSSKMTKDWAFKWIKSPHSFRHNTWMPEFFDQTNNSDPESVKRSDQEIHAMVNFLFTKSSEFALDPVPFPGDVQKGEELVSSLGCFACHNIDHEKSTTPRDINSLRQEHGPNLIGMGSKTSKEWIYSWIKDPNRYHPETKMPNLRLSDQEASDMAAYLSSDKNASFDEQTVSGVHEETLNKIVMDFLTTMVSQGEAKAQLSTMKLDDKLNFAGEKLINHYGCYSCHNIQGFENAKSIGVELSEESSKSVEKFDFGFIHIDHTKQSWYKQKLLDPRSFDKDKIKGHYEKLKMPNFKFTDKEADAVVTALLGFTKDTTVKNKSVPRTPENLYIEQGQKLIRQFNCQSCHVIEGEGGTIQKSVKDWLVKYDNRTEADAEGLVGTFSPPNLIGEGQKVQTQWLFEFLHQPTEIRPALKVRMPTYKFNAAHINLLIQYFNVLDKEEYPFQDKVETSMTDEEMIAAQKLFSVDYFDCAKCHVIGNKLPTSAKETLAPDFTKVKTRLKPDWIIKWIKNPPVLLPGTKMPVFFDPASFDASGPEDIFTGDENQQIKAMRNYLFHISESDILPASTEIKKDPAPPVNNAPAAETAPLKP